MRRQIRHAQGFTMVELITVMVMIGVLAAIAIPKLVGDNITEAAVYGDQVASALRLAQKSAVAKRRTVCLDTASGKLTVSAERGSGTGPNVCNANLDDAADSLFTNNSASIAMTGAPPVLRFQPDGSITDANNVQIGVLGIDITVSGKPQRSIRIDGGTGYVD